MKKLYMLLGLCAIFALPTMAQEEEDVTSYIANPGFDEDLTFQANGSWKEAIVTDKSFSDRSWGYMAADSTVYAHTKTTSTQKRSDGRKDEAVNGFFGQIKGWTPGDGSYTGKTYWPYGSDNVEWVYFGTVPYALASQAVPIADDGTTYLEVPAKPAADNGDDNVGFLYLRAGWGGAATYKQVVNLPCAQYRLEYWAININPTATKGTNLSRVVCRKDEFKDETGFNDQEWTLHAIEFTPTAEFTIEFGFKSEGGSGSNPFLCIDGIKLYKIGEADAAELLRSDIMEFVDSIATLQEDYFADYEGIVDQISDKVGEFEDIAYSDDTDAMEQALKDIKVYVGELNELIATVDELNALIETASELMEAETVYPGVDDLNAAIEDAEKVRDSGTSEEVAAEIETLNNAIKAYIASQEASEDNPADFTYFIDNPTFVAQGKWYIGQSGGDQRLHTGLTDNEGNAMTAWNAWRNNLTSASQSVSISQDITGLPNGKYQVTADMCTQDGCITDQHVFANGTAATAESPVMTMTGWDPYVWETLTTATVIVVDGKLTIGAIGHGAEDTPAEHGGSNTDSRRGWFCISNFKLSYLGEATEAEYAAAIQKKIDDAKAYAESMHLAADKATFLEVVNATTGIEGLEAMNEALVTAEASEAEYAGIMSGTYAALQDSIANSVNYTANAKKVAQVPVDYMTSYLASAEATYTKTGDITTVLRYYRDTLIPALLDAENTEISDATGKAALEGTIAAVVAKLGTYESDTNVLAEYIAELQAGIQAAKTADIAYGPGADVTAYITNPTVDAESGWTFNKISGNTNTTTSQGVDGVSTNRYIDSWNGTAGELRHTAYQVLNVPNGKYTLANIMRTSAAGAYLFASTAEPTKDAEDNLVLDATATNVASHAVVVPTPAKYICNAESETVSKTDSYGELWMAAADKVMAKFGITGVVDADEEAGTSALTIYDAAIDANGGNETCPDGIDEADWNIFSANGGAGRGWFNNSLEIEVTNHVLVIGVSCDSKFLAPVTPEAWAGTWFSADNFTLTMISEGDNTGWNPATGIEVVESSKASTVSSVYSISGARTNGLKKGINIVKMSDGTVKKVLVK